MQVLFDTNTWELVVQPELHTKDPKYSSIQKIYSAIQNNTIIPFISETVVTIEGVRKVQRTKYLSERNKDVIKITERKSTKPNTLSFQVQIGGDTNAHSGIHPILKQKLRTAVALGFKLISVPRLGTRYPSDMKEFETYRFDITETSNEDFWSFLDRQSKIIEQVEAKGYGRIQLQLIAERIQERLNITPSPWSDGLEKPSNDQEKREIQKAYAEWADGDTVAAFIANELHILCTEDISKSAKNSIFGQEGRKWLASAYDAKIYDLTKFASLL